MLSRGKSSYWQHVHPVGAIGDFIQVWKEAGNSRWPYVALAATATLGVFSMLMQESWKGPPAKPNVVYINSWTADRSDAEIERTNIANEKRKDAMEAEQAARDEKVKDIYRTLGKVSGMDVDKIERDAAAQDAREKAAHEAAIGLKPQHGGAVGQR